MAALQVAELMDSGLASANNRWRRVSLALTFVVALLSALLAGTPLAALAATGAGAWITVLAASIWTHSAAVRRARARMDAAASDMCDDQTVVADALSAMAEWRSHTRAALAPSMRIVLRPLQPIRPAWHEVDRAAALSDRGAA